MKINVSFGIEITASSGKQELSSNDNKPQTDTGGFHDGSDTHHFWWHHWQLPPTHDAAAAQTWLLTTNTFKISIICFDVLLIKCILHLADYASFAQWKTDARVVHLHRHLRECHKWTADDARNAVKCYRLRKIHSHSNHTIRHPKYKDFQKARPCPVKGCTCVVTRLAFHNIMKFLSIHHFTRNFYGSKKKKCSEFISPMW